MAFPLPAATWAQTAVTTGPRKLQGRWRAILIRCRVADEERVEPGTDLEVMQSTEIRNRRAPEQSSGRVDDLPDSPAASPTTSTASGTLTPGTSDGISESADSSIKSVWQRLSDRLGDHLPSRMSAEEREQLNHERGYDKFVQENLDKYPKGLPKLAALISCDDSLAMHRGFKYFHNRVLLQLEVQITELEKELYRLDMEDSADPHKAWRLKSTKLEEGWDTTQAHLIDEIKSKLKEYVEILRNQVFLQELGKPPSRNHRSYFNWHWTNKQLTTGYYDYIFHNSDFVNTSGKTPNYCTELIRDHMDWWPGSPIGKIIKGGEEMKKPTTDARFTFFSPAAERSLGRFLQVSSIMLILMTPVFLLFLIPMSHFLMAVTTASFIFLFALIMCVVTEGKVYEVFVGTATYGAVLIMFLGNISQTQGS